MSLYEGLKDAINFAKNAGNSEVMQKLIDVQTQILEMQQKMLDYHEVNQQLKSENTALKNSLEISKDVIIIKGYVYDKSNPLDRGPFCKVCWENNQKLMPIVSIGKKTPFRICNACGGKYSDLPSENEIDKIFAGTGDG